MGRMHRDIYLDRCRLIQKDGIDVETGTSHVDSGKRVSDRQLRIELETHLRLLTEIHGELRAQCNILQFDGLRVSYGL